MKILRATTYPPDFKPMHIIVREIDMAVPLEEVGGEEFGFLVTDIFSMDGEPSIPQATVVAMNRWGARKQVEADQALLFYWTLGQFTILKEGGAVISDKPMPLSEDDIRYAWRQLAKLDGYRNFDFYAIPKGSTTPITFKTGRES